MKLNNVLNKIGSKNDVAVAFIFKKGKALIGLRHYTPDKWRKISVWTIHGGRCDGKETLGTTLKLEALEEVGINDLRVTKYLGNVPGAKEGDMTFVFLAETNQEPKLLEPEKFGEWKWSKVSEIPSNFINPRVLKLLQAEE